MKRIYGMLTFVITVLLLFSHCYAQEWAITYGTPINPSYHGSDNARSIRQTTDGGYIVAGWGGDWDIWVLKLDSKGLVTWQEAFVGDETGTDKACAVEQTQDGGYIVAGYSNSFGEQDCDVWILKLYPDGQPNPDDHGVVDWQKTYGGSLGLVDKASSIRQTSEGEYIVAGENAFDVWILKLDEDGDPEWNKTYGAYGDVQIEVAHDILETAGGYIVAGESHGDMWVLSLNQDGDPLWQRTYGQDDVSVWERAWAIHQTSDDGYVLAGQRGSDVWIVKLYPDDEPDFGDYGKIEWEKTYRAYETGGEQEARGIQQVGDGGYVVTGYTTTIYPGDKDIWVFKIDQGGSPVWQRTYGGGLEDESWYIQQTTDSGYVIGGSTESFGNGSSNKPDLWLLKLDENGEIPGCSVMYASQVYVTETDVGAYETTVSPEEPTVDSSTTTIDPIETEAWISVICGLNISKLRPRQQEPTVPYPYMASWLTAELGYTVTNPRWGKVGIYGYYFGPERFPGDEVRIGDPVGPDVLNYNTDGDYYTVEDIDDGIRLKVGLWRNDLVGVYLFPANGEIVPALYGPGNPGLGTMWLNKWLGLWVVKGNAGAPVASNVKPIRVVAPVPD